MNDFKVSPILLLRQLNFGVFVDLTAMLRLLQMKTPTFL